MDKRKILFADDDPEIREVVRILLESEGYQVVEAENGEQAASAADDTFDLIILDVMMPDISGFEVAQQMKADPEMAEIPIIFLTALNSTADIVKGFQVGGNDFISKPFNKEELIIRVTHQIRWLQRKESLLHKRKSCVRRSWDATNSIL